MNWIMAEEQALSDYGIVITSERKLSDGRYIKHFELIDPHWVTMKDDKRVTFWTSEALETYLEYVEG